MERMSNILWFIAITVTLCYVAFNYATTTEQYAAVGMTAVGAFGTLYYNNRRGYVSDLPLLVTSPILLCGLVFMIFTFS